MYAPLILGYAPLIVGVSFLYCASVCNYILPYSIAISIIENYHSLLVPTSMLLNIMKYYITIMTFI